MSVVTSVTATPNRLYAVWELLDGSPKGMTQTEIASQVTPPSLSRVRRDDDPDRQGAILPEVLSELRNLHVIESGDEGRFMLTDQVRRMTSSQKFHFLEDQIVQPRLADGNRQVRVCQALAWLLTRDPLDPLPWQGGLRSEVEDDCGSPLDLTDEARSQQFIYWARHLGFAWRLRTARGSSREVVVVDPTEAVRRHLGRVASLVKQTPVAETLRLLAESLPLIDGGTARTEIDARLANPRRPTTVSRSLSLAFLRLEQSSELRLENLSDAPSMELDDGTTARPVSHLTWIGGH